MEFLYLLEEIRNPILDTVFSFFTMFGEETLFMVIGMIFFWCVDKYEGYYLLCTGFLGTAVNQFLKMLFRIPRPWVKDPDFTIVESARGEAGGYSFPSGHTQTSIGLFGGVARWNKGKVIKIICIAFCILVPFSRMYLGVHTPADVGVSLVIAIIMIFGLYPIFKKAVTKPKYMYITLFSMAALIVAYTLFVCLYQFPAEVYEEAVLHNLESARKNGFTLIGCILGFITVYTADLKVIKFETKAVWWVQIIKVIGGLAIVLAVKEGLRSPLEAVLVNELAARAVRYFLMVIAGGIIWPLTFNKFSKIGKKES